MGLGREYQKSSSENVKHEEPVRLSSGNFNSVTWLKGPRLKAVVMVSDQKFFSLVHK